MDIKKLEPLLVEFGLDANDPGSVAILANSLKRIANDTAEKWERLLAELDTLDPNSGMSEIGGIELANLVDKTAVEEIAGEWDFEIPPTSEMPTELNQLVNKEYVDSISGGVYYRKSVFDSTEVRYLYIGQAIKETPTAALKWWLRRFDFRTGETISAGGSEIYSYSWDDRENPANWP